jgi:hypothetical protein
MGKQGAAREEECEEERSTAREEENNVDLIACERLREPRNNCLRFRQSFIFIPVLTFRDPFLNCLLSGLI